MWAPLHAQWLCSSCSLANISLHDMQAALWSCWFRERRKAARLRQVCRGRRVWEVFTFSEPLATFEESYQQMQWSGSVKPQPTNIQCAQNRAYCYCPWSPFHVPAKAEAMSLLLKTPCIFETGPRDPWTRTDLDASSLKTSFHGTGECHASF